MDDLGLARYASNWKSVLPRRVPFNGIWCYKTSIIMGKAITRACTRTRVRALRTGNAQRYTWNIEIAILEAAL